VQLIREYNLYLAVSVDAQRYEKVRLETSRIAPGAYAVLVPDRVAGRAFWGAGYVTNSEALFAHAVMHVLDHILIEELDEISGDADNFRLDVWVKNAGSSRYMDYVWKWLSARELNSSGSVPNNFDVWKRFHALCSLGKIDFIEGKEAAAKQNIGTAHGVASVRKKAMADCTPESREGIETTGETPV
jgi:hypothetical protein